jgi:hypothetical protein
VLQLQDFDHCREIFFCFFIIYLVGLCVVVSLERFLVAEIGWNWYLSGINIFLLSKNTSLEEFCLEF